MSTKNLPAIAVFNVDAYETHYHFSLLEGVIDAARENHLNLLLVSGSELKDRRYDRGSANLLYRWIDAENVQGVVLVSILFNRITSEEKRNFCDGLEPLPLVGMGKMKDFSPCLSVDNKAGLQELIRHLIEEHGYRRLAFVSGPEQNVDAQERLQTYKTVMAEYKLFDPALVLPGDFNYEAGIEAMRTLWDVNKADVDAVICANDSMALGVLDALQARNIKVPEQVALVGFDDSEEAWALNPSLTTVRQPVYQLAYQSVEVLRDLLLEKTVPDQYELLTEPVYRRSCGCNSPAVQQTLGLGELAEKDAAQTLEALITQDGSSLIEAVRHSATNLSPAVLDQCPLLVTRLMTDIQHIKNGQRSATFLLALERSVRDTSLPKEKATEWHTLIASIWRPLLPVLEKSPSIGGQVESIFQAGHVLISEWSQKKHISSRIREVFRGNPIRYLMRDLVTATDEYTQMEILAAFLPELNIPDCYVALYDRDNIGGPIRLILAYEDNHRIPLENGERIFPTPQSLLGWLMASDHQRLLIMESLHFGNDCLGFMLFGVSDQVRRQVLLHIELREHISEGLQTMRLIKEVEQRNVALEGAYQTLRENQQRLLIAEKMASLGRLTAGIAHEMNTPLAAARAALRQADLLADEYQSSIGDPEVTEDDHREIARELISTVKLADSATERAASFVRDIKIQTRNLRPQEGQTINAVQAIENSLQLLRLALMDRNCKINFKKPRESIFLVGPPGRLEQVITNLVNNAIEASAPGNGEINIKLDQSVDLLTLQVSDKGGGISPENLARIFDPMFSTKPFGTSTGLGLTIVHDIVVGDFNGSIDVQSEVGEGATFTIQLPLQNQSHQ